MLLTWFVFSAPALAVETASEQAVRAAMVFNFLKFTDWPAEEQPARLQICVVTADPQLMAAMQTLSERQVRGKTVVAVRYAQQPDCSVLYVDARQRWRAMAEQRPPRALTIGGYPGFVADGGMIEVALQEEGGVRFDLNLAEARKAGLRFYPQLLRLARRVTE